MPIKGPPELWTGRSASLPYVLNPWPKDTKMDPYQKLFLEKSSLVCFFLRTWVSDAQQEDHVDTNYIWVRRRQNALLSHGKSSTKIQGAHFFLLYESTFPSIFVDIRKKNVTSSKACSLSPVVLLIRVGVNVQRWVWNTDGMIAIIIIVNIIIYGNWAFTRWQ